MWSACPGKLAASQDKLLPSNLMARCAAQPGSRCLPINGAERPMEACAWSMPPVSAAAIPVLYASSANGRAMYQEAAPGEHPAASTYCRVSTSPLEGLESSAPATSLLVAAQPTPPVTDRTGSLREPGYFPPLLSRAQRAHYRLECSERAAGLQCPGGRIPASAGCLPAPSRRPETRCDSDKRIPGPSGSCRCRPGR